jgi:hypothetical protein
LSHEPSLNLRLFGTDEEPAETRTIGVGQLSVVLQSGALRQVSIDGVEAIRGIAFVVRDTNWGTFRPDISDLEVTENSDGIRISYSAVCSDGEQVLAYDVAIEGSPDGSLEFAATGVAESDFLTSRTGFVVLHPIEGVAGQAVTVTHTDGKSEELLFPALISPGQPFFDIRALSHEISPGLAVSCTMEGDAFEMEDHRNWSDASYKTYIRPLSEPHPYTLEAGKQFVQRVGLSVNGLRQAGSVQDQGNACAVSIGEKSTARVPELALAMHPDFATAALAAAGLVRKSNVGRLVCTFDASVGHDAETMKSLARIGEETGAGLVLEAVLPLQDASGNFTNDPDVLEADIAAIRQYADTAGAVFDTISASPACYLKSYQPIDNWPSAPPLQSVYGEVRRAFPEARIAGGMHSYFTELNRCPIPIEGNDILTHSTSPIVHACDDISVMESLQSLPWIFKSASALANGKPYWIGPTAIAMRMNPYGETLDPNPGNIRGAMAEVDPRQRGLFNAAWTLGYIARAAAGNVSALCLSSIAGPNAIAWQKMRWDQPWFDELASKDAVFPVYHVIAGLAACSGETLLSAEHDDSKTLAALAIDTGGEQELWLANLTPDKLCVELSGAGSGASIETLDAATFESCCSGPDGFASTAAPLDKTSVTLGAYAVVRVAWTSS